MWHKVAAEDAVDLSVVPYMGFLVDNLNRFYPPVLKEVVVEMIAADTLLWRSRGIAIDLSGYRDSVDRRIEELLDTEALIERDWHSGAEACIRGTLITVGAITDSIERGVSVDEMTNSYPELTERSIRAAIAYAGAFRLGSRNRAVLEVGEPYIELVERPHKPKTTQ